MQATQKKNLPTILLRGKHQDLGFTFKTKSSNPLVLLSVFLTNLGIFGSIFLFLTLSSRGVEPLILKSEIKSFVQISYELNFPFFFFN